MSSKVHLAPKRGNSPYGAHVPRKVLLCLLLAFTPAACKSGGGDSEVAAWELDGNKEAAHQFVVDTVNKFYTDTKGQTAPLSQFAKALLDLKSGDAESDPYVLQEYYERSKTGTLEGEMSPLQQYIIQQFVISTNYLAFHEDAKNQPLQFTGIN